MRVVLAFSVGALGAAVFFAGCTAVKQDAASGLFLTQQLACVDRYDAKTEIDACREAVRAKWGRADAGAQDAGGQ